MFLGIIVAACLLISVVLGWITFITYFQKSKKFKYLYFFLYLGIVVASLTNLFHYSNVLGWISILFQVSIPTIYFLGKHKTVEG